MDIIFMLLIAIVLSIATFFIGKRFGYKNGTLDGYKEYEYKAKTLGQDIEAQKQIKMKEIENQATKTLLEAKDQAQRILQNALSESDEKLNKAKQIEERLSKKEEFLDSRILKLDEVRTKLQEKADELKLKESEIEIIKKEQYEKLMQIAKLTEDEAKQEVLNMTEKKYSKLFLDKINVLEKQAYELIEEKAKNKIVQAIQKYANEVTMETTVTTVILPSEDMKGRIIGREGRNIIAFEKATGVDIIIDDTPDTIIISCFDMVRKYVAKITLEKLLADGRIHPARIEEEVEKSRQYVDKMINEFGEKAIQEVGITGIHPNLIKLLGRLRFRTSYGQNILKHSIETAYIAEFLAYETGCDPIIAKKAALFHDIGKAVDHEIEGSHDEIGIAILKKFNVDEKIIYGMQSHHDKFPYMIPEAYLISAADAISASRPGARRESIDSYVKRLKDLENISGSFAGVVKAYAIQAGREIRVFVKPDDIDDLQAKKLALDIAQKIEEDMSYPGEIKVNVIRELRITETAR